MLVIEALRACHPSKPFIMKGPGISKLLLQAEQMNRGNLPPRAHTASIGVRTREIET